MKLISLKSALKKNKRVRNMVRPIQYTSRGTIGITTIEKGKWIDREFFEFVKLVDVTRLERQWQVENYFGDHSTAVENNSQ